MSSWDKLPDAEYRCKLHPGYLGAKDTTRDCTGCQLTRMHFRVRELETKVLSLLRSRRH